MLMTPELIRRLRDNVVKLPWAREFRDNVIRAAAPWHALPDEELWNLMFGPAPTRSWDVWSNGCCPTCKKPVPLYNWIIDGWAHPWKVLCPECRDAFPKNDFHAFYRSGLNRRNVFDPAKADRSVLFNTEHPDPSDPLRGYGVDDGDGYVNGENRWRFIGAYLIYGQWKHLVLGGINNLSAAYLVGGDPAYARQAAILLDRVADLYPDFDHKSQAWVEEIFRTDGYVSTWHDACEETREMALDYAGIRDAIRADPSLCDFLSAMARRHDVTVSKATPADVCRNIENGILRDPIRNPHKIHSNYPRREIALMTLQIVLDWPKNRAEIFSQIDDMVRRATAVDGVTGEKGLSGYSVYVIQGMAMFLAQMERLEPGFLAGLMGRHPALRKTYRFHIDTWCLQQYYPRIGDCGWFANRETNYLGVSFQKKWRPDQQRGLGWALHMPSMFSFLWKLHELTGDPAYVQALYHAALETEELIGPNSNDRPSTSAPLLQDPKGLEGLPYDLFAEYPAVFQRRVKDVIAQQGTVIRLSNVHKRAWHLAILRNGDGAQERAAWLDYDIGGAHGHNDGLNIGLFAKGLDLLPDLGYPPLQYAHAGEPQADWYLATASHNTVVIDGQNQLWKAHPIGGHCTLWGDGRTVSAVRAACAEFLAAKTIADQVEVYGLNHQHIMLYCKAPARITRVRVHEKPEPPWMLSFEDAFQRSGLGPDWTPLDGEWKIENGALVGHGILFCERRFRGYHRVEMEASALTQEPCDLSVVLHANRDGWESGVFFGFGSGNNTGSKLLLRCQEVARSEACIVPGCTHRILCECDGEQIRHMVDGLEIQRYSNTAEFVQAARAEATKGRQCERTLVQVSMSAEDSYYADIFRIVGGRDHAKFMHSHFGTLAVRGLNRRPAEDYGHDTIMRHFKSDPAATPGWSADWTVEDRYRILGEHRDIHLKYTDFTTGAEAATCEGWVVAGHFNTRQETWIPRIMVRRQAAEGTLASTFAGVMEPYEKTSGIASIRRLPLTTPDGRPYGDAHVALEVRLADGRSDLVLAADADNPRNERPAPAADGGLLQPDWGVRTDAELCVVRKNAAGAIVHVTLGQGCSFKAGAVSIALDAKTEFQEIDV